MILAAGLAAALLVTGGGTYWASATLRGPASAAAVWSIPIYDDPLAHATGAWLLDSRVVRGRAGGVVGYHRRTGRQLFSVALPGEGRARVCRLSRTARHGIGAVSYGKGDRCTHVMAVDASSGERLWRRRLSSVQRRAQQHRPPPLLAGDLVAVAYQHDVKAYAVRSGKQRWYHTTRCPVTDARSSGTTLLLVAKCYEKPPRLVALDPATGDSRWSRWLPTNAYGSARVLSVSPTIVSIKNEGFKLLSIDGSGRVQATIPERHEFGTLQLSTEADDHDGQLPLLVRDGILITTAEADGSVPVIAAFDLATGRPRWRRALAEGRVPILLPGSSPHHILVLGDGTAAAPPRLLRFDTRDGAMTVVALYPQHLAWLATDATVFASPERVLFVSREGVPGGKGANDLRGLVALAKPPPPDGWWPFW